MISYSVFVLILESNSPLKISLMIFLLCVHILILELGCPLEISQIISYSVYVLILES